MKKFRMLVVIGCTAVLFGCASGAKMENMVYGNADGAPTTYDKALKKAINVGTVTGGEETNPLWTSEISDEAFYGAIRKTLELQGLLSDSGRYRLSVSLLNVDQPSFGFDMTVTTDVKYTLVDSRTGKTLLNKTIKAPHTATVGDAFVAIERLRLANEGSGKKNIGAFMKALSKLKINPRDVSLAR